MSGNFVNLFDKTNESGMIETFRTIFNQETEI